MLAGTLYFILMGTGRPTIGISPNPGNGCLLLWLNVLREAEFRKKLPELHRIEIWKLPVPNFLENEVRITLPADINPGMYLLQLVSGQSQISEKLLIH